MPKVFCLAGLVVSILTFVFFFADLLFGLIGSKTLAPLYMASMTMDITFILASIGLGVVSWFTFKEQK